MHLLPQLRQNKGLHTLARFSLYPPDIFRTELYFRKRKSCFRRAGYEIGRATISLLPRYSARSITAGTEISPAQNTVQRAVVKTRSYIPDRSLSRSLSRCFLAWPVSTLGIRIFASNFPKESVINETPERRAAGVVLECRSRDFAIGISRGGNDTDVNKYFTTLRGNTPAARINARSLSLLRARAFLSKTQRKYRALSARSV